MARAVRGARPAGVIPPAPTADSLREAALRHVARFATTQLGLTRVLSRQVARWQALAAAADPDTAASAAAAARAAIGDVVAQLVAAGAVDDERFAAGRARRLSQSGRSRRTVAAHLQARGVAPDAIDAALPDDELAAAAVTMRRRRLGAFRVAEADAEMRRRELGALARAGFSQEIARQALALDRPAAEALIARLRRG